MKRLEEIDKKQNENKKAMIFSQSKLLVKQNESDSLDEH